MHRRVLLITTLLLLLTACTPSQLPSAASPWQYINLCALDPADVAQPEMDLVALYTRYTTHDLQIRLDLLDLTEAPQTDIFIALDLVPGGDLELPINTKSLRPWDILISIPSDSHPILYEEYLSISNLQYPTLPIPRVVRDPVLDNVTISLNANLLPIQNGIFYIQAFTTESGSTDVADSIDATSSEAQPRGRAPLLISFWNTLPAHTPAQALRRWDGAHTGPLGRRHGLKHLVDAAQRYQVPVTLLDLKSPLSLSALDILHATSQIADAEEGGMLTLPDTLPSAYFGNLPTWANRKAASFSRETGLNFGLSGSSLLYSHNQQPPSLSSYLLGLVLHPAESEGVLESHIYRYGDQSILPIPLGGYDADQITEEGLDLEIKMRLLSAALEAESSSPSPITVLGGDLPHTNWGDPLIVDLAMRYIAAHPWIQPLGENDLLAYERETGYQPVTHQHAFQQNEGILKALEEAPNSPITELAWEAYFALLAPADPAYVELPELRAKYISVVDDLITAALWDAEADEMAIRKECGVDFSYNGRPTCILSSENVFALIDPEGARLSLLFIRDEGGVHQVVGQTSQFAVGLSDPYTWDLSRGPLADPQVIPGAFTSPWEPYEISDLENGLRFASPTVQKDFILVDKGLRVEYQTDTASKVQVPLALAPRTRFSPGWGERYFVEDNSQGWAWGIKSGPQVQIETSGTMTTQTFVDDLPALSVPEDPNYDYPPGHFLPIPLAVATIYAESNFWVDLRIP